MPHWNLSGATPITSLFIQPQDPSPFGMTLSHDGLRMYMVGLTNKRIFEYDLPQAWQLQGAAYSGRSLLISAEQSLPQDLYLSPDGVHLFLIGASGDEVNQYVLSTPNDVSTGTFVRMFSVTNEEASPTGIFFKPDGTRMYVCGSVGDEINAYSLSVPWDISTATPLAVLSIVAQETNANGIYFSPDGERCFIIGTGNPVGGNVREYRMATPWDITSASPSQKVYSLAHLGESGHALFFSPDGSVLFILGAVQDRVYSLDTRRTQHESIDASAAGDNMLLPAVPGSKIRVLAAVLVASGGANTIRFKSGDTAVMGIVALADKGQLILPFNGSGWFETSAGDLLNLELSVGTSVAGALVYEEVE